jgi:hypothetical protein
MKSTTLILAAIAVPMAIMALQIDGELIALAISSGVALIAMIGLAAFLWSRPVGNSISTLANLGD